MRCEEVQPNLLDYGEGLLTGRESEEVRAHLAECDECAALLEEELAFSRQLSALPEMQPANDVWALVRAQTRPRRVQPIAWLRSAMNINMRRAAAAMAVAGAMLIAFYNFNQQPQPQQQPDVATIKPVQQQMVKWSDDPVGNNTDAVVEVINKM